MHYVTSVFIVIFINQIIKWKQNADIDSKQLNELLYWIKQKGVRQTDDLSMP